MTLFQAAKKMTLRRVAVPLNVALTKLIATGKFDTDPDLQRAKDLLATPVYHAPSVFKLFV